MRELKISATVPCAVPPEEDDLRWLEGEVQRRLVQALAVPARAFPVTATATELRQVVRPVGLLRIASV